MKLTSILSGVRPRYWFMYIGKYRKVKPVTPDVIREQRSAFAIEEQNMFYLRHPYLTPEQSFGHAKAVGRRQAWYDNWRQVCTPVHQPVTLEKHYSHLRAAEKWE